MKGSKWLNPHNNCGLKKLGFVQLGTPRYQFRKRQKKAMNQSQKNWGNFVSFYWQFTQGFSMAKPLTLMIRITTTRLAKNLPSDIAEDTEVGNGTSSTTKWDKNLPSDIAENAVIGGNGDGNNGEMVKRLPLSKKPSGPIKYFTSLRFNADTASFEKK